MKFFDQWFSPKAAGQYARKAQDPKFEFPYKGIFSKTKSESCPFTGRPQLTGALWVYRPSLDEVGVSFVDFDRNGARQREYPLARWTREGGWKLLAVPVHRGKGHPLEEIWAEFSAAAGIDSARSPIFAETTIGGEIAVDEVDGKTRVFFVPRPGSPDRHQHAGCMILHVLAVGGEAPRFPQLLELASDESLAAILTAGPAKCGVYDAALSERNRRQSVAEARKRLSRAMNLAVAADAARKWRAKELALAAILEMAAAWCEAPRWKDPQQHYWGPSQLGLEFEFRQMVPAEGESDWSWNPSFDRVGLRWSGMEVDIPVRFLSATAMAVVMAGNPRLTPAKRTRASRPGVTRAVRQAFRQAWAEAKGELTRYGDQDRMLSTPVLRVLGRKNRVVEGFTANAWTLFDE